MFLWNTDAPGGNKFMQNLKVLHFDPALSKGHEMTVRCEQQKDKFTVQVWLLFRHLA